MTHEEMTAFLQENSESIKAAAEIGDGIAKAMTENAMKNIIGHRGGELLKKLVDD